MRSRWLCGLLVTALFGCAVGCKQNPEVAKKKYLESGNEYMQKGKLQEARLQYRNALKLDPRFSEAYFQLAKADMSSAQWDEAFSALRQVISIDPSRLDARLSIGQLYVGARDYDK